MYLLYTSFPALRLSKPFYLISFLVQGAVGLMQRLYTALLGLILSKSS